MPLPCAPQQIVGQVLQMFPACSLGILPSTRSEQMQMGMILPITPMGVKHRDGTTPEHLAPDSAIEITQALRPTAHERAQYDRRVLVKSGAEHGRHRQDDMPIDDALMEHPAHLA